MTNQYTKLEGSKLWDKLLKANILEFERDEELRYVIKEYEAVLSNGYTEAKPVRVRLMLPFTTESIYLEKEDILDCEAVYDNVNEEIHIKKLYSETCYLSPFRLYAEMKIMGDE